MEQEKTKSKLPGCAKNCELQLLAITVGIQEYSRDENDSDDREKIDAILSLVENIERRCENIRSYTRECPDY